MSLTAVVGRAVAVLLLVSPPASAAQQPAPGGTSLRFGGPKDADAAGVTALHQRRRSPTTRPRSSSCSGRSGRQRHDPLSRHPAVDRDAARQRRHRPGAAEGRGEPARGDGRRRAGDHDRGPHRQCGAAEGADRRRRRRQRPRALLRPDAAHVGGHRGPRRGDSRRWPRPAPTSTPAPTSSKASRPGGMAPTAATASTARRCRTSTPTSRKAA